MRHGGRDFIRRAGRLRGGRLDGSLSAVAFDHRFCYPHRIELEKRK